jgi:hypothetical protein
MERRCVRCEVALEAGSLRARDTRASLDLVSEFSFIQPGTPTSWNPIQAFRQGVAGEPAEQRFPVTAWRCPQCGLLELSAARERP